MEGKDLSVQAITSPASDVSRAAKPRPNEAEVSKRNAAKVVDDQPVNQPKIEPLEQIARIERVEDRSLKIAEDTFSLDRIREKVAELERALPKTSNALSFSVDEVLNRAVITVIDKKSGDVLRTLPSEEVIRFVHNIEKLKGVIFEDES